jgi:hypothetical protein
MVHELESYIDDTKTLLSFPLTEADTGIKSLEEDLHKNCVLVLWKQSFGQSR